MRAEIARALGRSATIVDKLAAKPWLFTRDHVAKLPPSVRRALQAVAANDVLPPDAA